MMDDFEQLQIELLAHAVAIARHHAGLRTGFTDVQKVFDVLGVTEPFNEDDMCAVWARMVALSKADSDVVFFVPKADE